MWRLHHNKDDNNRSNSSHYFTTTLFVWSRTTNQTPPRWGHHFNLRTLTRWSGWFIRGTTQSITAGTQYRGEANWTTLKWSEALDSNYFCIVQVVDHEEQQNLEAVSLNWTWKLTLEVHLAVALTFQQRVFDVCWAQRQSTKRKQVIVMIQLLL